MGKRVFVLGADDPEMQAIKGLLALTGEQATGATSRGARVTPPVANKADGIEDAAALAAASEVILVECRLPATLLEGKRVVVVDHHSAGDPGFGRPAAEYLEASSVGQVWDLLPRGMVAPSRRQAARLPAEAPQSCELCGAGESPELTLKGELVAVCPNWCDDGWPHWFGEATPNLRLVAAADHCLRGAYQGLCPGVDPTALATWRAQSRASFQKRSVAEILSATEAARAVVRAATRIDLGEGICLALLRHTHVPELPEAGAQEGVGYLARVQERPRPGESTGRWKVLVSGEAPEVEAFLAWAPSQGLTEAYGDPVRGFAGAYEPIAK